VNEEIYHLFQNPTTRLFIGRDNDICKQVLIGDINARRPEGHYRKRRIESVKCMELMEILQYFSQHIEM
jgi:hypothetical protein